MTKNRGKHTSVHSSIRKEIFWLESLPIVKRVVLGPAEACRHKFRPGKMRMQAYQDGNMRLNVYTGNGVMKVWVHVEPKNKEKLLKLIEAR